jgi:hypothetical protein
LPAGQYTVVGGVPPLADPDEEPAPLPLPDVLPPDELPDDPVPDELPLVDPPPLLEPAGPELLPPAPEELPPPLPLPDPDDEGPNSRFSGV